MSHAEKRQWAKWTLDEEQQFYTALKAVGKVLSSAFGTRNHNLAQLTLLDTQYFTKEFPDPRCMSQDKLCGLYTNGHEGQAGRPGPLIFSF